MTGNRKALIEYRLTQAKDSIREADVLLQSGMSLRSVMKQSLSPLTPLPAEIY